VVPESFQRDRPTYLANNGGRFMRDENTKGDWAGSGTAASGGAGATDGGSGIDSTQPLRTTQGTSSWREASGGTESGGISGVVSQAKEGAGNVVGQVQETAGDVAGQVKQQAVTRLSEGKDRASSTLGQVAEAIRQTGTSLSEGDQPELAQYAGRAASQVERLSTYLQNRDVDDIIIEVQRFARRQPGIFLGGALALGLLGARFLKSSSRSAQDAQASQWDSANLGTGSGYSTGTGSGSYGYGRAGSDYASSGGAVRSTATGAEVTSGEWTGGSTGYAGGVDDIADDITASDDLAAGGTSGSTQYTSSSGA
jgi:hypothetical protein